MSVQTAWQTVYDTINFNVTDPESRGKKWIYASFPDTQSNDFNGFPIIIIRPAELTQTLISFAKNKKLEYQVDIEIYSRKMSVADSLLDDVISSVSEIYSNSRVIATDSHTELFDGKALHVRLCSVKFDDYN